MAIPKVGSFLGCCSVETGASVIGWINFVIDCIKVVFVLFLILAGFVLSCADLKKFLKDFVEENEKQTGEKHENVDEELGQVETACNIVKGVYIGVCIISLIITAVFIFIAYLCIKGVRLNDHNKIRPLMIVEGIFAILFAIGFLRCLFLVIIDGLGILVSLAISAIIAVYYGYKFIVLYSAFCKIRDEKWSGRVYSQPGIQPHIQPMQPSMQPMMIYNKA